jgi:hypothetical protein
MILHVGAIHPKMVEIGHQFMAVLYYLMNRTIIFVGYRSIYFCLGPTLTSPDMGDG